MTPLAIVLHRTYPPRKKVEYDSYPGDYGSIKAKELCQFLIGKEEGEYVQFMSTDRVAYHCDGANWKAFGVELSGYNEEPLTEWQIARLHDVLQYGHDHYAIPLTYADPATTEHASIWVNGGNFRGVISHDSVRTDEAIKQADGTWKSDQHSDAVTLADFQRAVEGDDMFQDNDRGLLQQIANALNDPNVGVLHDLVNDIIPRLQKIETKLGETPAPGPGAASVDLDALAAKVADVLSQRLAP